MGEFFEKVRRGAVAGPRKRTFTLDAWKDAYERYLPSDAVDKNLYVSGRHIHAKLSAVRDVLSKLSLAKLSTTTRVKALVAAVNHEYETLLLKTQEITEANRDEIHAKELAQLQVEAADGENYNVEAMLTTIIDGISIPIKVALASPNKVAEDSFSDVNWNEIIQELNLAVIYGKAESIWEDCIWNDYKLDGNRENMIAMPMKFEAKRGALAAQDRKLVLGMEATYYAIHAVKVLNAKGVELSVRQVKSVLGAGDNQHIEFGDNEIDQDSHTMLIALREMACPPYFESLIDEPQSLLGGLTLTQLFDGWLVVSLAARCLWEETSADRRTGTVGVNGESDMSKYIPFFRREALVAALQEATKISSEDASTLIEFLTFTGKGKQQLWTQPLVSIGDNSKLYPVFGAVASPPNLRFMLELWMAQLNVPFAEKGVPFEIYLREEILEAIATSPFLSEVAKVVSKDFVFKCSDESSAQIDALFCVGAQVFVVEAKCILEPTESTSIGTHRQAVQEGARQAKLRVALIEAHREEFIIAMKRFNWELPDNFFCTPVGCCEYSCTRRCGLRWCTSSRQSSLKTLLCWLV